MGNKIVLLFFVLVTAGCSRSDTFIRSRVVMLIGDGSCSGVQVHTKSGKDVILTASHCREVGDANGRIRVLTGDLSSKPIVRKIIAEDPKSDLLILEGIPNLRGLDIAKSSYTYQAVRTFTRGMGLKTYETKGMLLQEFKVVAPLFPIIDEKDIRRCKSKPKFLVEDTPIGLICLMSATDEISTAMTIPGSSGGPALDNHGDIVGIVSAGQGPFSAFVRLKDIQAFLSKY